MQKTYNVSTLLNLNILSLLKAFALIFKIGFTVVSLIFVVSCIVSAARTDSDLLGSFLDQGSLSAAVMNIWLTDRFGFGMVRRPKDLVDS